MMRLEYNHCATIIVIIDRQELSMDAKTWKFDEEQDIYINWKHLPTNYLLSTKGKISNSTVG